MKPAATPSAEIAIMAAENETLRRELKRLRGLLTPILSVDARKRITSEIEANDACGDTQIASDLGVLLESDTRRRAEIKGEKP